MKLAVWLVGGTVGVVFLVLLLPILAIAMVLQEVAASANCHPRVDAIDAPLDDEQTANAAIIVATTRSEYASMGPRAAVIAVMTAMQESSLRNLNHGDEAGPDSRGLYQQRLQFYTHINPMDPADATRGFLDRLAGVDGWATRRPTSEVIWEVQRFRDTPWHRSLYDEKEPAAQGIVDQLWPADALDAAPGAEGWAAICADGVRGTGPIVDGSYSLPVDLRWYQEHPEWFTQPHHDYPALDLPLPTGTTVYAVAGGTVVSVTNDGACGNGVFIDGDDGHRYGYCHGNATLVPHGAQVRAGDPILVSGNSGRSTGPHLHLQIERSPGSGVFVCPQRAMEAWAAGQGVEVATLPISGCIS
jgi:hypothetical protein